MRALHWVPVVPGFRVSNAFPPQFIDTKESFGGAWGYCCYSRFYLWFWIYCLCSGFLYLRDRHEQLHLEIEHACERKYRVSSFEKSPIIISYTATNEDLRPTMGINTSASNPPSKI